MRSRPFLSLRKMRMRRPSPSISGALAHVSVYTAAITPRVCTLVLFVIKVLKPPQYYALHDVCASSTLGS